MPTRPFSLLIKPAGADCNLRCGYCFYLCKRELYPDNAHPRMSQEILERMVRSFLSTDQDVYSFGWQGGEPSLMGLEFFQRVTELQQKFGRAGARVANGFQTNGTLLDDDWARHFARYSFLVGVSLDGPASLHDVYRHWAGGGGTHEQVLRGLRCLRDHGVEYNALTLVSRANVKQPEVVYQYLREQGILYHQYIECVEFSETGRRHPFAISGEEWGEFLCRLFDFWYEKDTRKVSIRLFDSVLHRMVTGAATVCCMGADCRQYFVVEHNGDVYPCDFYVEQGTCLGNVMNDSWSDLQESRAYTAFGKRKSSLAKPCETCRYLSVCAGDCLRHRRRARAEGIAMSVLCRGWKMFYEHTWERFQRLAKVAMKERAPGGGNAFAV